MKKMIISFNPLEDYGFHEPVRLIIFDNQGATFYLKKELKVGEKFCLSIDDLEPHLDYKFKFQTKSGGEWRDPVGYARLLPESETEDGIKYLFYPYKGSDKLVVVFQAINRKPGYNYIRTLSGVRAHRLYIKDEYGEDPETRTSYYLGKARSFDIANKVQRLIAKVSASLNIERSDCIFAGSSKGGFAALYHGYRFGAGHIFPGGPQVLLGNFLNSSSERSVHPPILEYIAGGRDQLSVAWANRVLQEVIVSARAPYPHTEIHVGRNEPHYREHVLPLMELVRKSNIPNFSIDYGDYGTHRELATHYPKFLRERVDWIARGFNPVSLADGS